jgi:hypothetical protein
MSSWETLAELAERELELIEQDRFDELAALGEVRAALVAALPAQAPPQAFPALERASELQELVTHALAAKAAVARAELERVNRGRDSMRMYASGMPQARRPRMVDRTG